MTQTYEDDVGGCCLPLSRRRGADGRNQGRRTGLVGWVRITIAITAALMLLILVVSLGHPSTQVTPPSPPATPPSVFFSPHPDCCDSFNDLAM